MTKTKPSLIGALLIGAAMLVSFVKAQDNAPGEIMRRAISLTMTGKSREEAIKQIETLFAQVPLPEIKQAADLALKIQDRAWRPEFLRILFKRWAAIDPEGVWNWFQKEMPMEARGPFLVEIFAAMGRVDFDRSIGRALELRGIDLANAFGGLAQGARSPSQQLQLLAQADRLQNADQDYVHGLVLDVWTANQPDEARAYVEGISDPARRSLEAQHVGPVVMRTGPEKGAEWWLNQTADRDRPKTIALMRAPEIAMSWANAISDPTRRIDAMREVYHYWRGQNPSQADQWLATARLTPGEITAITQGP